MGNPTGPMPQDLLNILPLFNNGGIILSKKNNNKKNRAKDNKKWVLKITFLSLFISGGFSLFSNMLLNEVNMLVAFILLAIIIIIGIVFDVIGIAVTAADEIPFHAMASKRIKGAKTAINLIRNADRVSSFCNDVIGDICGIVSGSAGIIIAEKILEAFKSTNSLISVGIGAIVAAVTIGGKSTGKTFAMNNSNEIVKKVSRVMCLFVKDR